MGDNMVTDMDIDQWTINNDQKVEKNFTFSKPFDGKLFYSKYENAEFLKEEKNIYLILGQYYELENFYQNKEPNEKFAVNGMFLEPGVPLMLKKSLLIDESDVDQDDFTLRRLAGLVAAYVQKRYWDFKNVYSVEAESFGVKKPQTYGDFSNYLSAVSGSQYFSHTFDFGPFIFALRRFQLKLISEEDIIHIGNIRDPTTQEPIAVKCLRFFYTSRDLAKELGFDLKKVLENVPQEIKKYFADVLT